MVVSIERGNECLARGMNLIFCDFYYNCRQCCERVWRIAVVVVVERVIVVVVVVVE